MPLPPYRTPANTFFILDDEHNVVPMTNIIEWAEWMAAADLFPEEGERSKRQVAHTILGDRTVSTIFLGIDVGLSSLLGGPPRVFETAVFDDDGIGETHRYSSWDAALAGHARVVERLRFTIH